MACKIKIREELIDSYVSGEMTEEQAGLFEQHFFECDECLDELKKTASLAEFVKSQAPAVFPEFFKEKAGLDDQKAGRLEADITWWSPNRISAVAIAAALLIVVVTAVTQLWNRNPDEDSVQRKLVVEDSSEVEDSGKIRSVEATGNQNDSLKKEESEKTPVLEPVRKTRDPDRFESLASLENIVGQSFRSTNGIKVESPKDGETLTGKTEFAWSVGSRMEVTLKILDNRGLLVLEKTTEENKLQLDLSNLVQGLYYWKLETEYDLLHVGKFFVE